MSENDDDIKPNIIKTCTAHSYIKMDGGVDEKDKKLFTVTLVLRTNGQIEVYSDYELTEYSKCQNPNLFCVDVVTDTEYFYLRYLRLDYDEDDDT